MAELVSKTYSEALFEVALEEGMIDRFLDEINFVADSLKEFPEFQNIIKSPTINKNEKKNIISDVFKEKLSQEMLNFLKIIIDKSRGNSIEAIREDFKAKVNNHKGIVDAVAITAIPMSKEDSDKLINKLSGITGKTINLTNEIDKSIIGGVMVKIGDKVIDGTLKGKLDNIKEELSQIIV